MGQPDYRIYELNKRLQQRTDVSVSIESRFDLLLFYFCLTYNIFFVGLTLSTKFLISLFTVVHKERQLFMNAA